MTELMTAPQAIEHRARRKWFLALGVLLLLLGLAGVGAATLLELTSLLVFGPLLLASSILQILTALFAEKGRERLLHLVSAGLELVVGFLLMAYPLQVLSDMVVLITVFLMASGLVRLIRALGTHSPGHRWMLLAGVGGLLLGICVWLRLPVFHLWFIGLCIAVDYICHGTSWSALAMAEQKFASDELTRR
jgi:uncharacterized membrane protein HdeD (DUF308 family)